MQYTIINKMLWIKTNNKVPRKYVEKLDLLKFAKVITAFLISVAFGSFCYMCISL